MPKMTNCITVKKNWFECPCVAHDVSNQLLPSQKELESYYGATKFMGEPRSDGTLGSRHMVHIEIT